MNSSRNPASHPGEIEAVRILLEKMGINPADLMRAPTDSPGAPTFADYIPRVSDAVSSGTRRVYGSYWNRVIHAWGSKLITDVTASDIGQLAEHVKATVVQRRNARGGRGAAEHLIAALRCMYKHAVADGILAESENPAARVPKPRRLRSTRTALPDGRLEEILRVAAATGDDPALDALLLRLHTETACRRGGALALMPEDLDAEHCLIQLHEKGETLRWQPVSPALMSHLLAHGESRGGLAPGQPLLRYANGRPITSRRYDYLWQRLGRHLPWGAPQHALDPPHHLDLGRAQFRVRHRPGLRRPRRPRPRRKSHGHLRPRRPPRGSSRTGRPDRRGSSAGDQVAVPERTDSTPARMTQT
jgi:integrase/recombinase XerC